MMRYVICGPLLLVACTGGEPGAGEPGGALSPVVARSTAPECSPCRALDLAQCELDPRCEGIPSRWCGDPFYSLSLSVCDYGERGFDGDCDITGCRAKGMYDVCPLVPAECGECYCRFRSLGNGPRGCLICECGTRHVAECAIDALCVEQPSVPQCVDDDGDGYRGWDDCRDDRPDIYPGSVLDCSAP